MTTAETIHSALIRDATRDDVCSVEARLVTDFDLLTCQPFRYITLGSDNGNKICVHQSDLPGLIRILRDVTLYAIHMEDGDDPYFSSDVPSYIEGYTHFDEGVARVILNHFHEFDFEKKNFVTLTKHSALKLVAFIEEAMDMIFIQDIIES